MSQVFPDRKEEMIGLIESAAGAGLIAGPTLGSFIYGYLGYSDTFYLFTSFLAFAFVQHLILIPSSINEVK